MGDGGPWLTDPDDAARSADDGVVTERGRTSWHALFGRARELAGRLPVAPHGWVVPTDRAERTVMGLLVVGLAEPAPSWVLGDPTLWATDAADGFAGLLFPAGPQAAPPPGTPCPTYATATSGSTGAARLLFGDPAGLAAAARLYAAGLPEFAAADVFATCSPLDFAAAFYLMLLPAVFLRRDLVLFRPSRWHLAAGELHGRPGVCLAPPALQVLGARSAVAGGDYRRTSFVPAGGGLTVRRAERVADGFPGCGFLTMLGSTETGLLTVTREVRDDGYVGFPLPGKPVWLENAGPDGVGTMWTRGPDTRGAATGGGLLTRPDGAVSTGDLAHRTPSGGYVVDGRLVDLLKVDGVSVYPNQIMTALRRLPGVEDTTVAVDRTGALDRLVVVVVGTVDEEQVRRACAALPQPVTPHRVVCRPADESAYTERGKVRL